MRWEHGFLCSGEQFTSFWNGLSAASPPERRGFLIAGRGIDLRTTVGPAALSTSGFPIARCCMIRLTNPFDPPDRPRSQAAAHNETIMRQLFADASFEIPDIEVLNDNRRLSGPALVRSLVSYPGWVNGFTDIIVDITALPTSVIFPLLGTLATLSDDIAKETSSTFNLHCIVCENPEVDQQMLSEGGDYAEYIDPFRGKAGLAGESDPVTTWVPVLGEHRTPVLRKIHEMLRPREVKPFLPSPSRNPRRGDDLVSEYRSLLFDTWEVGPRDFIYADERNPFDIYRQISELARDYEQYLRPLGTANTVVSTNASKLLSLGVFLAAFEHRLGVAHVEPTTYRSGPMPANQEANELFEVWLTGEAYEPV